MRLTAFNSSVCNMRDTQSYVSESAWTGVAEVKLIKEETP